MRWPSAAAARRWPTATSASRLPASATPAPARLGSLSSVRDLRDVEVGGVAVEAAPLSLLSLSGVDAGSVVYLSPDAPDVLDGYGRRKCT